MLTIKELNVEQYEKVIEATDDLSGLHCIIAIHSTALGPSLGGVRFRGYHSRDEALKDVLRLSKAMTYKSALAGTGLGGGKSVILAPPEGKTPQLLAAFARVIDSLGGMYIAAEDVGTTLEDMATLRKTTPYVSALQSDKSSGDPSRYTAWGVFRGIQAVAKQLTGSHDLSHLKIAIQGLGSVGNKIADLLFWQGAELILAESDEDKLQKLARLYGASTVSSDQFYATDCDILAPCALGGGISLEAIATMKCKGIAGAANNQLVSRECGDLLLQREILYAPDYIINAGGIINVAEEFSAEGYNPKVARDKVSHIYDTLVQLFEESQRQGLSCDFLADKLAEHTVAHRINRREQPIAWPVLSEQH
jgi:leucine dehydrogenase